MNSLMPWNPFFEPWEELEKMLEKKSSGRSFFSPATDVYQDEKNVYVEMSVAGIKPDDIEISIDENNVLHLKGETERKTEVDDKNYLKKEIRYSTFYQRVGLPSHVQADGASASYNDGVLKVSIPLKESKEAHVVKVQIDNKKK